MKASTAKFWGSQEKKDFLLAIVNKNVFRRHMLSRNYFYLNSKTLIQYGASEVTAFFKNLLDVFCFVSTFYKLHVLHKLQACFIRILRASFIKKHVRFM